MAGPQAEVFVAHPLSSPSVESMCTGFADCERARAWKAVLMHPSSSRICSVRDQGQTAIGISAFPVWLTSYEELARLMAVFRSLSTEVMVRNDMLINVDYSTRMNLATISVLYY